MSPALAGVFLTTVPPGKSWSVFCFWFNSSFCDYVFDHTESIVAIRFFCYVKFLRTLYLVSPS